MAPGGGTATTDDHPPDNPHPSLLGVVLVVNKQPSRFSGVGCFVFNDADLSQLEHLCGELSQNFTSANVVSTISQPSCLIKIKKDDMSLQRQRSTANLKRQRSILMSSPEFTSTPSEEGTPRAMGMITLAFISRLCRYIVKRLSPGHWSPVVLVLSLVSTLLTVQVLWLTVMSQNLDRLTMEWGMLTSNSVRLLAALQSMHYTQEAQQTHNSNTSSARHTQPSLPLALQVIKEGDLSVSQTTRLTQVVSMLHRTGHLSIQTTNNISTRQLGAKRRSELNLCVCYMYAAEVQHMMCKLQGSIMLCCQPPSPMLPLAADQYDIVFMRLIRLFPLVQSIYFGNPSAPPLL
jgi:hypothetical protein